jgi:hypothetical protein
VVSERIDTSYAGGTFADTRGDDTSVSWLIQQTNLRLQAFALRGATVSLLPRSALTVQARLSGIPRPTSLNPVRARIRIVGPFM